eukprot:1053423-Pyramimonas_sp.AAC.1
MCIRTAFAELRARGYMCDRITHIEVMTSTGTQYLGALLSGDYQLSWAATPADWCVRLPGKRAGPHDQRIQDLMIQARALRMCIVFVGPPGYFWKEGLIRDAVEDLDLQCDRSSMLPRGSYLQWATTCTRAPTNLRRCACQTAGGAAQPTEHELDWRGQGAQKAEWRNKALAIMTARLIDHMDLHKTQRNHASAAP